jgi:hypothetical protein
MPEPWPNVCGPRGYMQSIRESYRTYFWYTGILVRGDKYDVVIIKEAFYSR